MLFFLYDYWLFCHRFSIRSKGNQLHGIDLMNRDKLTIVTREQKETIEEDGYRIEVVGIEEWLMKMCSV